MKSKICLFQQALYKATEALNRKKEGKVQVRAEQRSCTKNGKLNAGRPWAKEDDRELRKLIQDQASLEAMCVILQRRPRGIKNRLASLGLLQHPTDRYGNRIQPHLDRMGTRWMPEEDEQLKTMFNDGLTVEEMMKAFHRTEKGIRYRLLKLHLIEDTREYPEDTATVPDPMMKA